MEMDLNFYYCTVMEWGDQGRSRISKTLTNNYFLLNTNRMFNIKTSWQGHSDLVFFDNLGDSRDGGSHMRIWGDPALIVLASDVVPTSKAITLDVFPDNDSTQTAVATTFNRADIAFVYPKGHQLANAHSYMYYSDAGWAVKRVLLNHSLSDVKALLGI